MIVAVDQTGIDTAVLILGVAMVNASQVAGLDCIVGSKAAWFLLALTSKMAGDMGNLAMVTCREGAANSG